MAQVDGVLEVIDDLKKKIDDLKSVGNDANYDNAEKINEIKQKAISVLSQASNKIVESAKDLPDSQELEKGLEIIKVKSKELYENAANRISKLINDSNVINDEKVVEKIEETIVSKENEQVVEEPSIIVEKEISNFSYEAIEILKGWLKPEVK